MARYKYTCPDVVHYRRNQYRMTIWSTVASLVMQAALWGWMTTEFKRTPKPAETEPLAENQE